MMAIDKIVPYPRPLLSDTSVKKFWTDYDRFQDSQDREYTDLNPYAPHVDWVGRRAISATAAGLSAMFDADGPSADGGGAVVPPITTNVSMADLKAKKPNTNKRGNADFGKQVRALIQSMNGIKKRNRYRGGFRGRGRGRWTRMRGRGGGRGEGKFMSGPPITYAQNAKSSPKFSFRAGRQPGCLRMHCSFRIAQVGVATINAVKVPAFINFGFNATNNEMCIPINGAMQAYYPPYMVALNYIFNEFYINSVNLRLRPRVNTSNVAVVTMVYSEDPVWPYTHGQQVGGVTSTTEAALSSLPGACTDVLYRPCVVHATPNRMKKFYTANAYTASVTNINWQAAHDYSANFRDTIAGLFLIGGVINGTDANGTVYADAYIDMDFELCGFNSAITNNINLFQQRVPRLVEKDEEEELILIPPGLELLSSKKDTEKKRKSASLK